MSFFDGTDNILRPAIRCEGVNGSYISSKTYAKGREFKAASASTRTVDFSS